MGICVRLLLISLVLLPLNIATSYIGQIEAVGMYMSISLTTLLRGAQVLEIPAYKFLEF